jgi:hypothetical protein
MKLRRRAAGVGVLVLLLAGGVAVSIHGEPAPTGVMGTHGSTTVVLYAGPPIETTAGSPRTSTKPPATARTSPTTTARPEAKAEPPAAPAPTAPCLNSFEPRCGDFQWQPPLGPNTPLAVSITIEPAEPVVGQLVTITIAWSDPEADVGVTRFVSPGSCVPNPDDACLVYTDPVLGPCPGASGPWRSPPPRRGGRSMKHQRVFQYPETFTWSAKVSTANSEAFTTDECQLDPWGETISRSGVITVRPSPGTTTTTGR